MDNNCLNEIDNKIEQERRDYKGPHCCMTMHYGLLSDKNVLCYNPKYREYGVKIPKTDRYAEMQYCICCGKQLPLSLRIQWAEYLKKEYGLTAPMNQDKKNIPKEFLSDEWWKKRHIKNFNNNKNIDHNNLKKNKGFHCCLRFERELLDNGSLLLYSSKYREYGIKIPESPAFIEIDYCLFCGKSFPGSLGDEWLNILEYDYKLEWPDSKDKDQVPKEFLTDEWWKKRGL